MKLFCIFLFINLCLSSAFAQRGFLLIKKNNKTIETYTTGAFISMQHKYGYTINGLLAHVDKDSFSILNFMFQKKFSPMGFVFLDTIYNGYTYFSVKDIKRIPKRKNKSILKTLQGASYLASSGYAAISIINGIRFGDELSTIGKNLAIKSGGFFAFGYFLGVIHKDYFNIGKRFKISLMQF
jgi:hypothetical protein